MIRTGLMDVRPLIDPLVYKRYYESIPKLRKDKADRMRFQEDRALSVGAWVLLEFMKEKMGLRNPVFNLSHSGDYVLCSLDDSGNDQLRLGCDVECLKGERSGIAERFFCLSEVAYINSFMAEEERTQAFYRLWVLKESFMKATRLGMKLDLGSFEISCSRGKEPELIRMPGHITGHFYYKEYSVTDVNAKIAVCCDTNQFDDNLLISRIDVFGNIC